VGIRETILFAKHFRAGEKLNVERPAEPFPGWNPDAPEHDPAFPSHPISRLRRILTRIGESAVLDEQIRALPRFRLPGRTK